MDGSPGWTTRVSRGTRREVCPSLESERFTSLEAKWKTHWSDTIAHAKSSRADELSLGEYLDAEDAGLADLEHHRVEHARMTRIMADAMDPEGTGRITSRVYKAVFGAYSLSGEQIDAAFALMVPGRDFMTRTEFERYADEFFSSDDPQALGNNFFGIPGWGRSGGLGTEQPR